MINLSSVLEEGDFEEGGTSPDGAPISAGQGTFFLDVQGDFQIPFKDANWFAQQDVNWRDDSRFRQLRLPKYAVQHW